MLHSLLAALIALLPMQEVVQKVITTDSGVTIPVRLYQPPFSGAPTIIVVHDWGESNDSWNDVAARLQGLGFSVVQFSLRGHRGSGKAWYYYSDRQIARTADDLTAVLNYAREQSRGNIFLLGAGLGANLALSITAENEIVDKVVAISPGLRYRGIDVTDVVKTIQPDKMLFVSSLEDVYSTFSIRELIKTLPQKPQTQYYSNAGHGIWLLKRVPEAVDAIARWLSSNP